MKQDNGILEELKSMGSILADMPRTMPYSVPHGYFGNFGDSVKNILKDTDEDEQRAKWGKILPYAVPDGYFETLPREITAHIVGFNELPKAIPFDIPAGYFETLPAQMLQAAKNAERPARIIPLRQRILKPIKWAAAAMLVLGIGLGSYRIFYNTQQVPGTENILSSVPNDEIHDYVLHNYNRMDVDKVVSGNPVNNMNIDNKDIVEYLNETGWD